MKSFNNKNFSIQWQSHDTKSVKIRLKMIEIEKSLLVKYDYSKQSSKLQELQIRGMANLLSYFKSKKGLRSFDMFIITLFRIKAFIHIIFDDSNRQFDSYKTGAQSTLDQQLLN